MNQTSFFRMKRSSRMGTYGFVLGAVLLAVLIAANLLVGALPKKATVFDVSSIGITEISDETATFVSGMEEDVTIYWLCMDGVVDDQMELLLTRYEEAGKHIRVEMVDTTANPTFTDRYTEAAPEDFSMIVESGRRFTIVNAADMYYYINDFVNEQLYSGTVMPMTEAQIEKLAAKISAITGKTAILTNVCDPSVIGGVSLMLDGTRFDGSIQARLENFRQQLSALTL